MNLDKIEIRNWSHDKKIYNSMLIVKFIILLFCVGAIYLDYAEKNNKNISQNFYCNALNLVIIIICLVSVYFIWMFISIKAFKFERIKTIQVIENTISIVIFTFIIMMSGSYKSSYKFLFLVAIITATIQLGMKHGIITSLVSSIIILAIDLILAPKAPVNIYFETDLILVGVFIMTAWPLGYYVNIQKEDLRQKEEEVNILANKLDQKEMQKRCMEQLLIKNENCYNLLIENARDAIIIHRKDKIVFANESAAELLICSNNNELQNLNINSFILKEEQKKIRNKLELVYRNKRDIVCVEQVIQNNKRKKINVESISTYIIYNNKPAILSILRDITSQKQVEKLQKDVEKNIELLNESREYNKLITDFLANISHELKTPLNVIFTAVQILDLYKKDAESYDKKEQYIKVIKQNCYRLMRLINNLLDTTKLDSGYLKLNLVNCNIVNLVEEITLSVVYYAESKNINIIFDTDVEEKIMAVDPDKIERIVLNLLSNAIKFTGGGGNIYVTVKDFEDNIIISVKDTGIGIPEDKIENIFDRFVQVDKTLRRNKEGSGIGLYLVKSFVNMHEGTINIQSEIGKGSEFIINIPIKLVKEDLEKENNVFYSPSKEYVDMEFADIYSEVSSK
ncbi:PAS domain S-box protein [Clostridium botulinum]|uniref:PAS domain-containing sensor histidine kinase n=1 Tax=Clostridium botulinum TaxID=1491 RepID=UPI0013F0D3D4|nr:PAS domain-containing sensor histidine kinase [Clostridium botulinum]MBY6800939.1 PAS domain-containing sensor histidine kinase [Clostridium botulinum]NFF20140.1 PAS domain S-box protein [Clostridium botulinum]NFP80802.1 PAS domain S-box protein [Clostridium botulinum]NFP96508.1 PAS domain S-box protein [Clostridium botulinum]NFS37603.1 PAS domain S-box protein [Clostridium botulinum]